MLSFFRLDIYSKQPYVLKEFYSEVLELPLLYANEKEGVFEVGSESGKVAIVKSLTDVKNRIKVGFGVDELKPVRLMLTNKNVVFSAIKVKEGRFFFELKDPDGNEVVIYQSVYASIGNEGLRK